MKKLVLILYLFVSLGLGAIPTLAHAADACGGCQSGFSCITTSDFSYCAAGTAQPGGGSNVNMTVNPANNAAASGQNGSCPNCNLGYVPLEPIPGLTTNQDGSTYTNPNNLANIIGAIFKIFITVGALLAVLMLTIGGIQYMVSPSAEMKNEGINRAKAAMWGVLLIAASWLILNTINPKLLEFNLNPCPNGAVGCTVTGGAVNNSNNTAPTVAASSDPTVLYTDQTSCEANGNVWMFDSQTCIPPISQTLSHVGSSAYNLLMYGNSSGDTSSSCSTKGGNWTQYSGITSYFSNGYCTLP